MQPTLDGDVAFVFVLDGVDGVHPIPEAFRHDAQNEASCKGCGNEPAAASRRPQQEHQEQCRRCQEAAAGVETARTDAHSEWCSPALRPSPMFEPVRRSQRHEHADGTLLSPRNATSLVFVPLTEDWLAHPARASNASENDGQNHDSKPGRI
jgi:hypothetical protein